LIRHKNNKQYYSIKQRTQNL